MTFLPTDFELPKKESNYMKMVNGDNKFRVLSEAITGFELWINKKPVRRPLNTFTKEELLSADINTFTNVLRTPQYFWAFVVWNYAEKKVQILQISKKTILDGFLGILSSWGEPTDYDITITRKGEKTDTTYLVLPNKPEKLHKDIKEIYEGVTVNLKALFEGKDPFAQVDHEPKFDK